MRVVDLCRSELQGGNSPGSLGERILDPQAFNLSSMLEVLAIKRFALTFSSAAATIIESYQAQPVLSRDPQCFNIKGRRRVDCQKRSEYCDQILFGFRHAHRLRKASQGNIEEFLHHLVANDSLSGIGGSRISCAALFALAGALRRI